MSAAAAAAASECAEQVAARELLQRLRAEMGEFRRMQARGEAPPSTAPGAGGIDAEFERTCARLEREAARPASARLPFGATPPREVLTAVATAVMLEEAPAGETGSSVLTRYIQDGTGRMFLGVNMRALPASAACNDERTARTVPLAAVPWRADMGAWQPLSWAWLLALLYRKAALRCPLGVVSLTYKAQDAPRPASEPMWKPPSRTCAAPRAWRRMRSFSRTRASPPGRSTSISTTT